MSEKMPRWVWSCIVVMALSLCVTLACKAISYGIEIGSASCSDDDGTDEQAPSLKPQVLPTWEILCPGENWGATCIHHNLVTGAVEFVDPPKGEQ